MAEMCCENQVNKSYLVEHALEKYLMKHIQDVDHDFKEYFLVKELIKGNSALLTDCDRIHPLIHLILDNVARYPPSDIRKSIWLDILSYTIVDNGEPLKTNQNLIVKKLFTHNNHHFVPREDLEVVFATPPRRAGSPNKILDSS